METIIPFSGFYNSVHDYELEQNLDRQLGDSCGDVDEKLRELTYESMDWVEAHRAYAEKYTEFFADKLDISAKFIRVISPREYNFETDRILADIPERDIVKLRDATNHSDLNTIARERFTSRSGFSSFYKPDYTLWTLDLREWDHNQMETMVRAAMLTQDLTPEDIEYSFIERVSENGFNVLDYSKKQKLIYYVLNRRDREEQRSCKTA